MKPQVSELHKLLRMAGSRRRKLVKDIETMKDFLKTLPKALEYTRDEKTRYLEKRNKQLEQWVEVIDWLYQQIAQTDDAVSSSDNISIGFTNAMTDEEKRDMLIKVSEYNRDNHSAHLIHILDVQPASETEDAPLPVAQLSPQAVEDDGDVVKPEFDAESSATFPGEQGANHKDRGCNKRLWGILACIAIAILALCGILFS